MLTAVARLVVKSPRVCWPDGFDSDATNRILASLARGGHIHDNAGIAKMHAGASGLTPVQRQALGYAQRYGIAGNGGRASVAQADEALRNKSASIETRLEESKSLARHLEEPHARI
jgi:hypothetical protein